MTSDSQCIKRANQQLAYQNECVGILISANCYVSGSSSEPDLIPHLNKVIPQLNGLQGWSFKQTEATEFEVSKKLSSTNEKEAEQELDRVRVLLNYVAITRKVGIRVVRYSIAKTPRFGPSHGITGPPEWMMPPLSKAETGRSAKFVSLSPEIHKIADGLNQVYLLTSLNSRLSLLWAIMEAVFIDKPDPLLSDDEIESVISSAMRIPTLEGDARLNVLENALKDPNRIPKKSRNRRISENIAIALNLNADDLYQEIKNTSKVRGEYLHELKTDIQEMRQAEKFLRTILERHLEANMK